MTRVGGREFISRKASLRYFGGVSPWWLRMKIGTKGFPTYVRLSDRITGFWKDECDNWLALMSKKPKRRAA